jgi:hypothetical protein
LRSKREGYVRDKDFADRRRQVASARQLLLRNGMPIVGVSVVEEVNFLAWASKAIGHEFMPIGDPFTSLLQAAGLRVV